jgi:hypothetical protein
MNTNNEATLRGQCVGCQAARVDTANTWLEPIGVLSLLVEGAYVVLAQGYVSGHNEPRLTAAR